MWGIAICECVCEFEHSHTGTHCISGCECKTCRELFSLSLPPSFRLWMWRHLPAWTLWVDWSQQVRLLLYWLQNSLLITFYPAVFKIYCSAGLHNIPLHVKVSSYAVHSVCMLTCVCVSLCVCISMFAFVSCCIVFSLAQRGHNPTLCAYMCVGVSVMGQFDLSWSLCWPCVASHSRLCPQGHTTVYTLSLSCPSWVKSL